MTNPTRARVTVAMADTFVESLLRVPRKAAKKVQKTVATLRTNPAAPGLHYEPIQHAPDPELHSVRVGDDYRAILKKPNKGNLYVLLWLDHHDEAYQWAMRRKVIVHPQTGAIQILSVDAIQEAEALQATEPPPEEAALPRLFAAYRDRQLKRLGVPEPLLPLVRRPTDLPGLEALQAQLPQEAFEALCFLASGEPYEEVVRLAEASPDDSPIDVEDYAAALKRTVSLQRFVVAEDELELQAILEAPLETWRIFLHPSQRRLVNRSWEGPVRVLGGAGTGKTVVAMHQARHLASTLDPDGGERILFTTFTRNLAADISENLRKLCPGDDFARIEVIHLDKWVSDFLKRRNYPFQIAYFTQGGRLQQLWENALHLRPQGLPFPDSFYREEWAEVVQAQGCQDRRAYLKADRTGRGTRLSFSQRKQVWTVFEEYRTLLDDHDLREREDAMRDARAALAAAGDVLPYRSVIVDEAQDMGNQAFKLLRQLVPPSRNDLFIVGDAHQRIYPHRVVLSRCGVAIRGRSHRLRINYRTTDEIRRFAVGLLEDQPIDDLDGGQDTRQGYRSLMHGVPPEIRHFKTFQEEVDFLLEVLKRSLETAPDRGPTASSRDDPRPLGPGGATVCLVARTGSLLDQYAHALTEAGVASYRIRRSQPEDRRRPGLRLATMHRVKGLEFDVMLIAGVNAGVVPLRMALDQTDDPAVWAATALQERALLYVALTRARREAVVTSFGAPSPFLAEVRQEA